MKNIFKALRSNLKKIFLPAMFWLLFPGLALAIKLDDVEQTAKDEGLATYGSFEEILATALTFLLQIGFILAIIFVVISGYKFLTASGNEEKITKAKQQLLWSIVGILVIGGAWFVLAFVVEIVKTGNVGT